jgi:glycosyltransferase involved in cell wall biosynthesis
LAIKNAIIKFIEDKETAISYGKKGRKRALKLFDEKKIINLQIKILKQKIRTNK